MIIRSRSALGLKYLQIVRGTSDQGFPAGSTLPLVGGDARAGRVRPAPQHLRRADAGEHPGQPDRVRQRARRPRAGPQRGDRRPEAAAAPARARDARHLRPADGHRPVLHAPSPSPPPAVAPVAETQAQMFVDLDTHPGGLRRHRPALPPGHDLEDAGHPATRPARRCRSIRPFLVNSRKLFVNLQPGVKAAAESADEIESALRHRHPGPPRLAEAQQPAAADRGLAAAVQRRHAGPRRADRLTDLSEVARAAAPVHRPGAVGLQLRDAALPQRRQRRQPGQRDRQLAARQRARTRRTGPTTRAARRPRPANGGGGAPIRDELPPRQPLPEHRLARPDRASARPATRPTQPASSRSATPPATRGS